MTVTLNDFIESELVKQGFNELVDSDGKLVFFDYTHSHAKKIQDYTSEVSSIVDRYFFNGLTLNDPEKDTLFKQSFLNRFLNREINRQTIEAFSSQVAFVFMTNSEYINRMYSNLDDYLLNKQVNNQQNDSSALTDNRSAFADLPQNNVQLDVASTVMDSATDNTISRNKQLNEGSSTGTTTQYRLDELLKINGLLESIFNKFDAYCFLQVW